MEAGPGYKVLQHGVGTNPVLVPPAPGPPQGQVLPGQAAPTQWMSPPKVRAEHTIPLYSSSPYSVARRGKTNNLTKLKTARDRFFILHYC